MMGQADIRRLFEILLEYQELSPEAAKAILERILMILQEWKDRCSEGCLIGTEEDKDGNGKM